VECAELRDKIVEVKPHVIKVAETRIDLRAVGELLKRYDAAGWLKKTRRHKRSGSEFLTELAGRVCYRSFGLGLNPNITKIREDPRDYLRNILRSRHGSVLEHSSVTFAFLNVSRVFTHELVRHRAGTAISQESFRYVRPLDLTLWLPVDLRPVSRDFLAIVEEIGRGYRKLEAHFPWDEMSFEQKKRATSALRRILPSGLATNVIWTANHRAIRWAIEMRTNPSAEVEIREVFGSVAQICKRDYPLLYGDFTKKVLGDGTFQYVPEFSKV
jgi:thymidylate synthase (FAD)